MTDITRLRIILASFLVVSIVSCRKTDDAPAPPKTGKLAVVATLFPVYDFTRNIGGDKADILLLLPPGTEAHSFEPRPGDFAAVKRASLFVYTGELMEPWAADILKGVKNDSLGVVDASKGVGMKQAEAHEGHDSHHGADPHIWLDFANAQIMVDNIAEGFAEKDMANRDYYIKNAGDYKTKLAALDAGYTAALRSCKKKVFVHGGHYAFGYLARRYGLQYLSAAGLSPDSEPSPATMVELVKLIRQNGLGAVFYEELIRPNVAETIAMETGAKLLPLHGAHNVTKDEYDNGVTFIALMGKNLERLKEGLECDR